MGLKPLKREQRHQDMMHQAHTGGPRHLAGVLAAAVPLVE
jgi:hypothetical protein